MPSARGRARKWKQQDAAVAKADLQIAEARPLVRLGARGEMRRELRAAAIFQNPAHLGTRRSPVPHRYHTRRHLHGAHVRRGVARFLFFFFSVCVCVLRHSSIV
jgi:hypothetical protein